jgi:hypothetical protein
MVNELTVTALVKLAQQTCNISLDDAFSTIRQEACQLYMANCGVDFKGELKTGKDMELCIRYAKRRLNGSE